VWKGIGDNLTVAIPGCFIPQMWYTLLSISISEGLNLYEYEVYVDLHQQYVKALRFSKVPADWWPPKVPHRIWQSTKVSLGSSCRWLQFCALLRVWTIQKLMSTRTKHGHLVVPVDDLKSKEGHLPLLSLDDILAYGYQKTGGRILCPTYNGSEICMMTYNEGWAIQSEWTVTLPEG